MHRTSIACIPKLERENAYLCLGSLSVSVSLSIFRYRYRILSRSHAPRGNAYLHDEHFITSCFGEATNEPHLDICNPQKTVIDSGTLGGLCVTSPKVVVVVATWNKYGMRSHAGAWERD